MFDPIATALQNDRITFNDGDLPPFVQISKLTGDHPSPPLFIIILLLKTLFEKIPGTENLVKVLSCADNLVVYGNNRFQTQSSV